MKEYPVVSVVVPIYNVEKYLKNSVNSIIEQTYKNIEIILVNDGSPDRCPEICDEFAEAYSNISVIHKENGGLSEARNYGLKQAIGDYILFLDSDDTLNKNALEELVEKIIKSNADLIIPDRFIEVNEITSKEILKFHFDKDSFIENPQKFALEIMVGKGRAWRATALLYRTDLIKNNNIKFPVGYVAEDIIFNLKIMSKAKKIGFYENSTIHQLKRVGSITTSFQKDLDQVYLFIDNQIENFLNDIDMNNKYGEEKRNELLCRNSILYITDLFSNKCDWKKAERIKKANELLDNKYVQMAFRVNKINPYFNNRLAVAYFKLMFKLIKNNNKECAYKLAIINNKL